MKILYKVLLFNAYLFKEIITQEDVPTTKTKFIFIYMRDIAKILHV